MCLFDENCRPKQGWGICLHLHWQILSKQNLFQSLQKKVGGLFLIDCGIGEGLCNYCIVSGEVFISSRH